MMNMQINRNRHIPRFSFGKLIDELMMRKPKTAARN